MLQKQLTKLKVKLLSNYFYYYTFLSLPQTSVLYELQMNECLQQMVIITAIIFSF